MAITETLQIPLTQDDMGVIRVGGTRVTLDTLVSAFNRGDTAEEIAQQYPVLHLNDIYAVIAYYLGHKEPLDKYLVEQKVESQTNRALVEARCPPDGIRDRLLARRV